MIRTCPDCNTSSGVVTDSRQGTEVCSNCGLVLQNRIIDMTLETRNFAKDSSSRGGEDQKRVGGPNNPFLSDSGIGTVIGNSATGDNSLSKWGNRSTHSGMDRALLKGFDTITHFSSHLHLNEQVQQQARKIFKHLSQRKGLGGRPHYGIVAACLYRACRLKKNAKPIKQIASLASIERKELRKCIAFVNKYYIPGLSDVHAQDDMYNKFAIKVAADIGYPVHLQRAAGLVSKRASDLGIVTGKNPMSVASAAVYIIGLHNPEYARSFHDISEKSEMKEITIKNCAKILHEHQSELLRGILGKNFVPLNRDQVVYG